MSELKEELQTVPGVGEATADKLLDVIEAHDADKAPGSGIDPADIEEALSYAEAGHAGYVAKLLRRVVDGSES